MAQAISRRSFVKLGTVAAAGLGSTSILAGCGGSGSGSSDSGTIKVGILGPFTGDVAQYGTAVRAGAELYIKQVNDKGGVNGKQIDVEEQDEKGDATEAVNAYNKMVEDGCVAIIGDVTSAPSAAVAQASVSDNMPLVSASATASSFTSYGSNAFRACITDPYQGTLMADFAAKQGYKTVATIFNSGGDYEKGVNDTFVEEAAKKGITIVDQEGYAAGDVDFNAQLTKILAANPDVIFCPNYYNDAGKIVTQARQLGYKGPFMGADGWSNIAGGDQDYASFEDLEGCFYDCSFISTNEDQKVQQFIKDYKEANGGTEPTNFCALGYDAAMVLLNALETVEKDGKAKAGTADYSQAVIDAIASGSADGVTGTIKYAGSGDPVKPTLVITFEGGKQKVFDTIQGS